MKELELNTSDSFTVQATNPRCHTGIILKKGNTYKFEVVPNDQTWKDGNKLRKFTANGRTLPQLALLYLFIRMPFVKWFALLGSIDSKRSTYFKIGIRLDNYSPSRDGELICFANDALGFNDFFYAHNNEGEMKVVITRIR